MTTKSPDRELTTIELQRITALFKYLDLMPQAPCKYGHLDCAVSKGGRCSDEWRSDLINELEITPERLDDLL